MSTGPGPVNMHSKEQRPPLQQAINASRRTKTPPGYLADKAGPPPQATALGALRGGTFPFEPWTSTFSRAHLAPDSAGSHRIAPVRTQSAGAHPVPIKIISLNFTSCSHFHLLTPNYVSSALARTEISPGSVGAFRRLRAAA